MAQVQATLVALLATASLCAQEVQQRLPPLVQQQPAPGSRRSFDRVIGVFGDEAILNSMVRVELNSRLSGMANSGRDLSPQELAAVRSRILFAMLEDRALAHSAANLPGSTPEKVDQIVNHLLEDRQRQEEQRAGSLNRLTEELGIIGQTWSSFREAEETRLRAELAQQQSLQLRYRDRFALMVTPQEVRRFFDENPEMFARVAQADVEIVTLEIGADPQASLAVAQALAKAWRAEPHAAVEMAAAYGGTAMAPRENVRDIETDANVPELKSFAANNPEGAVSEPIRRGSRWWVLRIAARTEGRDDSFDDPAVQAFILGLLVEQKIQAVNQRLIRKGQDKFRAVPWRSPGG